MKIFSLIFLFNFSFFSLLAQGDFQYGININDKTKVYVTTAQMSSQEVLKAIHKKKIKEN